MQLNEDMCSCIILADQWWD